MWIFYCLSRAKICTSLIISLIMTFNCLSQTASINTTGAPPDPSAGLDINIPNTGFLIPRIALTDALTAAPLATHVAGMIVFNTTINANLTSGLYYNNGSKWIPVSPDNGVSAGTMLYWNGSAWVKLAAGLTGQRLQLTSTGIPAWSDGIIPALTTAAASSITSIAAISGGNITSDGGSAVTARGVCWNISPAPTTANNLTSDGTGMGSYVSNLTGLVAGTTYYVRAYATNPNGTSYGNEISFTTP